MKNFIIYSTIRPKTLRSSNCS